VTRHAEVQLERRELQQQELNVLLRILQSEEQRQVISLLIDFLKEE
jgi:hypothetical protein